MANTVVLAIGCDAPLAATLDSLIRFSPRCVLQTAADLAAARAQLAYGGFQLALVHLADPSQTHALLDWLDASRRRSVLTIVLSEEDEPALCLKMLRAGAVDCLCRPFALGRLSFLVDVLAQRHQYQWQTEALTAESDFIAVSEKMRELVRQFQAIAPLDTTVVLCGPSGTGKNRVAQLIHELSPRRSQPFVALHCAGLAAEPLRWLWEGDESAVPGGLRRGKFAEARQGTLLLDAIDALPAESQLAMLAALENQAVPRAAAGSPPLSPRLIVAGVGPLEAEVAAGRFRADLFYRLSGICFHLPPLAERRRAVVPLADRFLAQVSARRPQRIREFSPEAYEALQGYEWPGNLRELQNAVQSAAALCRHDRIDVADLPEPVRQACAASTAAGTRREGLSVGRREGERRCLLSVLRHHRGNRSRAAHELGISRTALYKKLRQHGLA